MRINFCEALIFHHEFSAIFHYLPNAELYFRQKGQNIVYNFTHNYMIVMCESYSKGGMYG